MTRKPKKQKSNYTGTSVLFTEETLAILATRSGKVLDRSTTMRILLGWYNEIVLRERPEFADPEWNAIRDALNGTWLLAEGGQLGMLAAGLPIEFADACRLDGIAEKWGIDGSSLVARLSALGFAARVAILDDAIRFWARSDEAE